MRCRARAVLGRGVLVAMMCADLAGVATAVTVGPVTDEVCRDYIKHMEALICGGMLNERERIVSSE